MARRMAADGAGQLLLQQVDPTFLPFIRSDRYGEGGLVVPFWASVRLALLACTLLPLRLIASLACVAAYYLTCRLVILIPHELLARRIVTAFGKLWSRACLFCLGFVYIKWTRLGDAKQPRAARRRSVAVVSNHMSWADILIHMARYFPAFVARDGTQNLAMIGLISQRMQCIYVDREKKGTSRPTSPPTAGAAAAAAAAAADGAAAGGGGAAAQSGAAGQAAGAQPEQGGVSGQVKRRMLLTQQHPELELRPMLLFPEGTTTNGRFLLPFKTGAFLAGVPVLPTIIHYRAGSAADDRSSRRVSRRRKALAALAVAACAAAAAAAASAAGAGPRAAAAACAAAAAAAAVLASGALSGKGGVAPCWESIDATRHLLLMLCQPFHTVECYELPLYQPSPEEQADPRLYAANVRDYMLKYSAAVMGPAALRPSQGLLEDKRRYQAWLRSRRQDVEAGRGLGPAVFRAAAPSGGAKQADAAAASNSTAAARNGGSGARTSGGSTAASAAATAT